MAFPCPGCGHDIARRPEAWALRCPACGAVIRSCPAEASGRTPAFDVEIAGKPETRRRIEVPWDEAQTRRLRAWLLWSSVVTLGLVALLYALARLG